MLLFYVIDPSKNKSTDLFGEYEEDEEVKKSFLRDFYEEERKKLLLSYLDEKDNKKAIKRANKALGESAKFVDDDVKISIGKWLDT
jgi:hypothetical protein